MSVTMSHVTTTETVVLGVHLVATSAMAGLIWFVQWVHYPLFCEVGSEDFIRYETQHQARTAGVVGPFMAVEGVLALWLLAVPPGALERTLPLIGCVALAVIHTSTVFLQVPAHGRLAAGFDTAVQRRLVRTNWIRTIGWSVRSGIAVAMFTAV